MKQSEINEIRDILPSAPKEWRKGQAYFNILRVMHEEIAEEIRGTEFDPFHHDDRIPALEEYLLTEEK